SDWKPILSANERAAVTNIDYRSANTKSNNWKPNFVRSDITAAGLNITDVAAKLERNIITFVWESNFIRYDIIA
ncbi:hypothetical protein ACHAXH_001145, partial [Discostella pseudostelligera]